MGEMWSAPDFVGGHPALDFLNTVADKDKRREMNKLRSWPAMRRWAAQSKLLAETEIRRFAGRGSSDSDAALDKLIDFRETAYAAVLALSGQGAPNRRAVSALTDQIRAAMARGMLEAGDGHLRWRADPASHHCWTDAITLAFEDLLRSEDFARIRQCGRCTWLFIDRGRGIGRRWCDMRTCGNRAKAQAFRAS